MSEWKDRYDSDDDNLGEEWKGEKNQNDSKFEKFFTYFELLRHTLNLMNLCNRLETLKGMQKDNLKEEPKTDEPPSKTKSDHTAMPVVAKDQIVSEENVTGYMEVYDA